MSHLPPLDCLVAFEVSARYMSFTKAAKELHLSQSAISRRISQLEEYLGRILFERSRGVLNLTPAGLQYAEDVRSMLNICTAATNRVMAGNITDRLTVACSSGLATYWLAPRLGSFLEKNPDTHVRVLVRDNFKALVSAEYDIGLYHLHDVPSSVNAEHMFSEQVFAICSPEFLDGKTLEPEGLLDQPLIALEDADRNWMSWDAWFQILNVSIPRQQYKLASNRYSVVLQMAMASQGIALGWANIVDRFIDTGALVKASNAYASLGGAYYLCWPLDSGYSPPRERFMNWVRQQSSR